MENINDHAAAEFSNSFSAKMLKIYDPAMCCSSGICGPSVAPVLARFTGTLDAISRIGTVAVERLPYIFIDGELAFQARYPEMDELAGALGITIAATRHARRIVVSPWVAEELKGAESFQYLNKQYMRVEQHNGHVTARNQ